VENEQIEQFDACQSSFCSVGSVRSGTKGVGTEAFDRGCQNRRSIRSWLYKKGKSPKKAIDTAGSPAGHNWRW
jgi:hypothetical protein